MDGDGRDDLVLDAGQSLRVCLQRADGGFDALPGASYLGTTEDSRALLRDFDGDGDVDVFTGDLVLRNDGAGALTPDAFTGSRAQGSFLGAMAAGDLDDFVDGATADLGPGIVVQEVVADDGHAGVRVASRRGSAAGPGRSRSRTRTVSGRP